MEIQNGGSNMANGNAKSYLIRMILGTRGFLGIADYESELRIQKFRMTDPIWQAKLQKLLDWDDIWYPRVFGVAHYISELKIQKFEEPD